MVHQSGSQNETRAVVQAEARSIIERLAQEDIGNWQQLYDTLEESLDGIEEKVPREQWDSNCTWSAKAAYSLPRLTFLLTLKVLALVVWETLRHPIITSRIEVDESAGLVTIERWKLKKESA